MSVTDKVSISLPAGIPRRILSLLLGFGVAAGLAAAPFLGAKRIPGFEPLIAIFPEEYRTLLIPFSSFIVGLITLGIQFYAGEVIARQSIKKGFGTLLLIVLASTFTLLVLYVQFVKKVYIPKIDDYEIETIGWSRLPSPPCGCPPSISDAACIEGLSFDIESCWSSVGQVKLALSFSYLFAIEGFALLVGLLVLRGEMIREEKIKEEMIREEIRKEMIEKQSTEQPKKTTSKRTRAAQPADSAAKRKKPKTKTAAPTRGEEKPPEEET